MQLNDRVIVVATTLVFFGQCHAALRGLELLHPKPLKRQLDLDPKCKSDKIGDSFCDDENNNLICDFDGGDCCTRRHDDWNSTCVACKCYEPFHPNFDAEAGPECTDIFEDICDVNNCNCGMEEELHEDEDPSHKEACNNYRRVLCKHTCGQCEDDEPKCLDTGCGKLWAGDENSEGVCVDLYHNKWSTITKEYDVSTDAKKVAESVGLGNTTLCRPSDSAYVDPNRDCCRCFRKPVLTPQGHCTNNGCNERGGLCVNLLDADLTNPNSPPRSTVDLDKRLPDGLCNLEPNKRHCCDCYMQKNTTTTAIPTTTSTTTFTTTASPKNNPCDTPTNKPPGCPCNPKDPEPCLPCGCSNRGTSSGDFRCICF